jgi:ATP-dependent helicase/nuclease subunit A
MKPVDHAQRQAAIHDLELTVALSAGAGSGKTSVLVERVLSLLGAGVEPRAIAVVTFTEKAAGELQERLRDRLEERSEEPRIAGALERFHELTLSTLHGFCQQLLSGFALLASWAPDTEIIPEGLQSPAASPLIARWREDYSQRHPAHALILRSMLSGPQQLPQGIQRLMDSRDADPVLAAQPLDFAIERARLARLRDDLRAISALCTDEGDKLLRNNEDLLSELDRHLQAEDDLSCVVGAWLAELEGSLVGGRKAVWDKDSKEDFKDAVRALRAWRTELGTPLHAHVVGDLREHLLPAISETLRRHGQASYSDLLFRSAELLESEPEVRGALSRRFRAVLIDEVQDTDPIQARVAALLTRPGELDGDWDAHPPSPGHLFAVGDAKQSIFRFRRADVATWRRLRGLAPQAGRLELVQNFRSVPGVVHWVNEAFADLPDFEPQVAWRDPAAMDPVVHVQCGELDPGEVLSRYLSSLEGAQVIDRDGGQLRALRMQDVMVVLPSWSQAEALHQALAASGIASVVEGGRAFFDRAEVQLGLSALRALDEPGDTEATAEVLRGLFGLSFEDLARHVQAGGSLRFTLPEQPEGPVTEASSLLLRLHRLRGHRSLVRLLDELLEETAASATWSLLPDGQARLANLDKLRVLVRQIESLGATSDQVLDELRRLKRDAQEEELSRLDSDLDAVRITSVFKAKGREAPVVVVACAQRKGEGPQHRVEGRRAWVKLSALTPPGWTDKQGEEKRAFDEERGRWMYVAATRARDQLVVLDDGGNLLEWMRPGLPGGEHQELVALGKAHVRVLHADALPPLSTATEAFPGLDVPALLETPPQEHRRVRDRSIHRARRASRTWTSVGQVARQGKAIYGVPGGVGARGGTLVHQVLERLDLNASKQEQLAALPSLVQERALIARLPDELSEACLAILQRILSCPELDLARRAPLHWREASFTYETEHGMLTGIIDLAFPLDEAQTHWMVIDWKSTLPPQGHPARGVYQRQLELYAQALIATVAPCERVTTALVGPHPELGQDALPELDLVFEELGPVVQRLLDAGAPPPVTGLALGEPVVGEAELAWPELQVCLVVDHEDQDVAGVRALGWTVVSADSGQVGWELQAGARLQALLEEK